MLQCSYTDSSKTGQAYLFELKRHIIKLASQKLRLACVNINTINQNLEIEQKQNFEIYSPNENQIKYMIKPKI